MSIDNILVQLLRPLLARATRCVLREELEGQCASAVFSEATRLYQASSQALSREQTVGVRIMLVFLRHGTDYATRWRLENSGKCPEVRLQKELGMHFLLESGQSYDLAGADKT